MSSFWPSCLWLVVIKEETTGSHPYPKFDTCTQIAPRDWEGKVKAVLGSSSQLSFPSRPTRADRC